MDFNTSKNKNRIKLAAKKISESIVANKSDDQVRKRIMNQKKRKIEDESHPITYIFKHHVAIR